MKTTRRRFLATVASASALPLLARQNDPALNTQHSTLDARLEQAAAKPVLDLQSLKGPIIIQSVQLLKKGREYFVRVRSKDGAEGISVDNGRADILHPVLNQLVIPYFIGKDALELEEHLFGVYRYKDNYKLQGLALWCPVALVEFAILDMLGRIAGKSLGELLGGVILASVGA